MAVMGYSDNDDDDDDDDDDDESKHTRGKKWTLFSII